MSGCLACVGGFLWTLVIIGLPTAAIWMLT
jgi:hypothetical protein